MQIHDNPRDTDLAQRFIASVNIETLLDANQIAQRLEAEIAHIGLQKERNNLKVRTGKLTREERNKWDITAQNVIRSKKRQIRWIETWKSAQAGATVSIRSRKNPSYRANYYDLELDAQRVYSGHMNYETIADADRFIELQKFELGDIGRQIESNRIKVTNGKMEKKDYTEWYGRVLEIMILKNRQIQKAVDWKFDRFRECYVEANPVIDATQILDRACRDFSEFILSLPDGVSIPPTIRTKLAEVQELRQKYARLKD